MIFGNKISSALDIKLIIDNYNLFNSDHYVFTCMNSLIYKNQIYSNICSHINFWSSSNYRTILKFHYMFEIVLLVKGAVV